MCNIEIKDKTKDRTVNRAGSSKSGEKLCYPIEMEISLLSALRKGEADEAKRILDELLTILFSNKPEQFKYMQFRATELAVLISRVLVFSVLNPRIEINPVVNKNNDLSLEIYDQNLEMIQDAKTTEELSGILHQILKRTAVNITSLTGIPHAAALQKAVNFIKENFTRKISLKEIAGVAGLSPPYFSTIFREEMGENLSKYLNRKRVEKASQLLLETDMSLAEIAAYCCFEDQSWFSKIFKSFSHTSPGKYRNQGGGII